MFLAKLVRMLSPKKKAESRKRFFRPRLDVLEDRRLLATFTVDDSFSSPGPNQFNTIQEAVDAAFANGPGRDTINVKAGTYNENVLVNTTVTIQAQGKAIVDPVDDGILGTPVYGFDLQANDIVIKGFRIGDFDGDTTSGGGDGSVGINTSSLFSGYQILNNTIESNVFGIYLNTKTGDQSAKETLVQNNTILRNNVGFGVLPAAGNGIYSDQGAQRVRISKNTFQGQGNEDVIFVAPSALQTQIKVENNTLRQSSGIFFVNVTGLSFITGNTIRKSAFNAIELGGGNHGVTIKGNNLDRVGVQGYSGIYLHDFVSATPNEGNTIIGNTLNGTGLSGIRVRNSNSNTVKGNTVLNTQGIFLTDGGLDVPAWGNGIGIENGDNNIVDGNVVKFSARNGIYVDETSEGNLIVGNTSVHNAQLAPPSDPEPNGWDYFDASVGTGTAGTANDYRRNKGRTDNPDGLIQTHI